MIETAFTGRLGREPELKTSAGGKLFVNVPVAVGNGDATVWIRVAVFGADAEDFARRAHKGDAIAVEGRLTLNTFQGRDGAERTGFNVAASYVRVCEIGQRRPRRPRRSNGQALKPAAGTNDFHSDPIGF
jgi:single-stranded DNA-binding protein